MKKINEENFVGKSKNTEKLDNTVKKEVSINFDNIPFIVTEQSINNFNLNKNISSTFSLKFKSGTIYTLKPENAFNYCPRFSEEITDIMLPEWITECYLKEYFMYAESDKYNKNSITPRILLKIGDFFLNKQIVSKLILFEILPNLNKDNNLEYLIDSQLKLNESSSNNHWISLYSACLNFSVYHLNYYLSNSLNQLMKIDKKTIEDILEKYLCKTHNDCSSDSVPYKEIIELLLYIRGYDNVFELVSNDYLYKTSHQGIMDITQLKPMFSIKFKKSNFKTMFYKEFNDFRLNKQEVSFILFTKKNDCSLNISYRVNFPSASYSNMKIMAIVTSINFNSKSTVNFKVISSNKSLHNIFSSNLDENSIEDDPKIDIYLKINYIQSFIQSYILLFYDKIYNDINVCLITRSNFFGILNNTYLNKQNENQVVISLLNWLNKDKNLKDDVQNIIELINWKEVNLDLVFEFVIRYSVIIDKYHLNFFFSNVIEDKVSELKDDERNPIEKISLGKTIATSLFCSSNRIKMTEMFDKVHRIQKRNINTDLNLIQSPLVKNETTNFTASPNYRTMEESSKLAVEIDSKSNKLSMKTISLQSKEYDALKQNIGSFEIKMSPKTTPLKRNPSNLVKFLTDNFKQKSQTLTDFNNKKTDFSSPKTKIKIFSSSSKSSNQKTEKSNFNSSGKPSKFTVRKFSESNYDTRLSYKKKIDQIITNIHKANLVKPIKLCKHKNKHPSEPIITNFNKSPENPCKNNMKKSFDSMSNRPSSVLIFEKKKTLMKNN